MDTKSRRGTGVLPPQASSPPHLSTAEVWAFLYTSLFIVKTGLSEPCCGQGGSSCCFAGGPQAASSRRMRGARSRPRLSRTPADSAPLRRWNLWTSGLCPHRFTTPTHTTSRAPLGFFSTSSTLSSTLFNRTPSPKVRLASLPLTPSTKLYLEHKAKVQEFIISWLQMFLKNGIKQ